MVAGSCLSDPFLDQMAGIGIVWRGVGARRRGNCERGGPNRRRNSRQLAARGEETIQGPETEKASSLPVKVSGTCPLSLAEVERREGGMPRHYRINQVDGDAPEGGLVDHSGLLDVVLAQRVASALVLVLVDLALGESLVEDLERW